MFWEIAKTESVEAFFAGEAVCLFFVLKVRADLYGLSIPGVHLKLRLRKDEISGKGFIKAVE